MGAWEEAVRTELESHAGFTFPILFEELLFTHYPDYYDRVVEYML
jgi:hypothetical protein